MTTFFGRARDGLFEKCVPRVGHTTAASHEGSSPFADVLQSAEQFERIVNAGNSLPST